jgi:TonB family protein
MKRNVQIVLLLYMSGLCCADVSAQQSTAPDSKSDVSKGNVILVRLFKPVYPPLARQADISGEVKVAVTVRPDGTTEAALESGHAMLKQAALDSATQSHFECRMCSAPLPYTLVYEFKQIEGPDCCSAFSAPVMVEQAPQSTDEQGHPQTRITIAAEHICLCDPSSTLTMRVRSIKCLYLWKCSVR